MAIRGCSAFPSITGTLQSDCSMSYPGHTLVGGSYSSAEKQSLYSTTQADWAIRRVKCKDSFNSNNSVKTVPFQAILFSKSTQSNST